MALWASGPLGPFTIESCVSKNRVCRGMTAVSLNKNNITIKNKEIKQQSRPGTFELKSLFFPKAKQIP